MKRNLKRAAALILAALLAGAPAASASQALGTDLHHSSITLGRGVQYVRQYLWSATYTDLRTERYLEYAPNELVQPAVAYGSSVLARGTLTGLAQGLESQGRRVLGGINGDYFVLATGVPLGIVITDGVLRSSSSYLYALGFDAEGNAFIGQPNLNITAAFHGSTYPVTDGLNKIRSGSGGFVLYTSDFADSTNHTQAGVDVILTPLERDPDTPEGDEPDAGATYDTVPVVGGHMRCVVEEVLHSEASIPIPAGKLVLSISNTSNEERAAALAALQQGDLVDLSITSADGRWANAVTAIGGLYRMVENGVVTPDLETTQHPRSAVGVRADGSTVFYTVDGRQSGVSVGASMDQVAQRLVELGCVDAVCMDGGGSTTFGAALPGQSFGVQNSPSDGSQRSVTNALFLTAPAAAPGDAESLVVTPSDAIVLPGTSLRLSAAAVDGTGQVVQSDVGAQYDVPAGAGTLTDGVFTAGTAAGTYTLTAWAGELTGNAIVTVVSAPDKITVSNQATGGAVTAINLEPGGQIDLTAASVWRNLPVQSVDASYTWSVTGDLGTIDENGLFTAGETGGTGSIQVSAGGKTVTIPLSIAGHILLLEDFEGSFDSMADTDTAHIEPETRSDYVRYGLQSARLTYNIGDAEYAAASVNLPIEAGEKYLNLWVYGDGSGNTLAVPMPDADGQTHDLILAVLNFTGWQQVNTPLPAGPSNILVLKILPTGTGRMGIIWVDQATSSNEYLTDLTPPTVSLSLSGGTLTAALGDDVDKEFPTGRISVTYDGRPLEFSAAGTSVTAALPAADGLAHRVTVTVTDASGNIGRASMDLGGDAEREAPFSDSQGHWAETYINYLYDQGISNGVAVGGAFQFQPNKDITRGEFALMVARWLRLDLEQYSSVELPFVDAASIPAWALDGVKAMYQLGFMQGSSGSGGTYAFAERTITRAEAITMLGRIQAKGYASAELNFTDAAEVPAWADSYIRTLAAQGVINGRQDGSIAPSASITRCEIAKMLYTLR